MLNFLLSYKIGSSPFPIHVTFMAQALKTFCVENNCYRQFIVKDQYGKHYHVKKGVPGTEG